MSAQQLKSKTLFETIQPKDLQFAYQQLQEMICEKGGDTPFVVTSNFPGQERIQVSLMRGQDGSRQGFVALIMYASPPLLPAPILAPLLVQSTVPLPVTSTVPS